MGIPQSPGDQHSSEGGSLQRKSCDLVHGGSQLAAKSITRHEIPQLTDVMMYEVLVHMV